MAVHFKSYNVTDQLFFRYITTNKQNLLMSQPTLSRKEVPTDVTQCIVTVSLSSNSEDRRGQGARVPWYLGHRDLTGGD